ncbi:serine protease [Streptomyces sp. NPDC091377]|uniref:serine protease n=1 Tax=Streptomyces sp. NPDC091377 TaxID=3365995 RepID=UPI00381994F6
MAGETGPPHRGAAFRATDGPALVRLHDLAGRPRGLGFLADHHGTLITSHEAVDGLPRLVLRDAGDRVCVVGADEITVLPGRALALVRTTGLGADPLPVTVRDRVGTGAHVRVAAGCWRAARVLAPATVSYAATTSVHTLDDALELAIGTAGRDALRYGGGAAGGPVLDDRTGTVVGVIGTALRSADRDSAFAVPLRPAPDGPLAALLARNAATVPAYGTDLNLAGVLELTATSVGSDGPAGTFTSRPMAAPVERAEVAGWLAGFAAGGGSGGSGTGGGGGAGVLALVGLPGSGRTTELAALAARRGAGPEPAPTLWLRGADLADTDLSVADAAGRALARAGRIVAASRPELPEGLGDVTPERLARLARAGGRPLLILLDGPEEMPPVLAHRLAAWTRETGGWLRESGARMVVGCREEFWERVEDGFGLPGADPPPPLRVSLGDLTEAEAREARFRYGIPDGALHPADARHPLTLRLLSEVRAVLPDGVPGGADGRGEGRDVGPNNGRGVGPDVGRGDAVVGHPMPGQPPPLDQPSSRTLHHPLDRYDVLAAYLDLVCLRIALRLGAQTGLAGDAVRRLAAKVAGQVHEAARDSLGPGQGELDRAAFEAVFPWGPAPRRLGGGAGWASAVLAEGLLVPAGDGYRFAHEELADWIQGMHLDLDEALRALVHRGRDPALPPNPFPVPRHRIGPVVQALLLLARQQGPHRLALRMQELVHALDVDPDSWWALRLLREVLLRVPQGTPYVPVLRLLADRLAERREQGRSVPREFGPAFWTTLAVPEGERLDLLRRMLPADAAPREAGGPRFLDTVAALLAADAGTVQPHLVRWFHDERALPATPHATVATAAQALLHTHRHRALDDLTETLADQPHPRSEELLAALVEEEPSALCRAVDRWARDVRPGRHELAMTYGTAVAPYACSDADRDLLGRAAHAVLAVLADARLHGAALGLLVRDPRSRARCLGKALTRFGAGDPALPASAMATAVATDPEAVLGAFRVRLVAATGADAAQVLAALLDTVPPAVAGRVTALVREVAEERAECAGALAGWADRRLDSGAEVASVVFPLVSGVLGSGGERLRAAVAGVLGGSGPLRTRLRESLLAGEREPAVLDALLRAVASAGGDAEDDMSGVVRRIGELLVRTPEGAARFDRGLVDLGRHVPGFAGRVAGWLTESPRAWAALVGPSTRRMIGCLAGVSVPV